jgi:hypothetical protein
MCVPDELWLDTENLHKCLVKALDFDVDLSTGDLGEIGMTPGVRG